MAVGVQPGPLRLAVGSEIAKAWHSAPYFFHQPPTADRQPLLLVHSRRMKSLLAKSDLPATSVDIAWRVLALVNVFRLLVPLLLTLMFVTIKPTVGQA